MKTLLKSAAIFLLAILSFSFSYAQDNTQATENADNGIQVYYFHFTHRCATCKAVESVSKSSLEELFPDKMKNGQITFEAVNLDEPESDAIAKKLEVTGQTLLFVKGEKQVNLTNDGFMLARTDPDKLKEEIRETIEKM